MFKFLIIVVLVGYVLYKLSTYVQVFTQGNVHQRPQQRRPLTDDINIDTPPPSKKNTGKNFKGGEYVDYEEIK